MRGSAASIQKIACPIELVLLMLGSLLAATPAWTLDGSSSERTSSRVVEVDIARAEDRFEAHRLAPPRELPRFDLGTGNTAYLIPAEGASLVVSAAGGRLVRWIDLDSSDVYGLLEPRIVLSRFQVHEDLVAVTMEYSYVLPGKSVAPDHLWSFVGVCRIVSGSPAADCQQVEVWQAEVPAGEGEDAYAARRSVGEADPPLPYAASCLRIRDHDGDGFRDLILERRWWRPSAGMERATASPEPDLLWLRFDPEQHRFLTGRSAADPELSESLSCAGPDSADRDDGAVDRGEGRGRRPPS